MYYWHCFFCFRLNRNEIFTDCAKKAKNKEDDNTSNNIHVEVSFNLTAFVSWTTVILESFCVMAWNIMKCIILHVVTGQVNVHYIQEHFSRQKL